MLIIPAIDIKDGKCVRLAQGDFKRITYYADNPVDMARLWAQKGAELIHVVDLDGSVAGCPVNAGVITEIAALPDVRIQVGGGIRDMETINLYFSRGVSSVILGTSALQNEQFVRNAAGAFKGKVILGIDALNGKVAIRGWTQNTEETAIDLARRYEHIGLQAIVYTDIQRDGMQTGVNVEATRNLARQISVPVIASGGVATIADVEKLLNLKDCSIYGVIIGRALYTGSIDLADAIEISRRKTNQPN